MFNFLRPHLRTFYKTIIYRYLKSIVGEKKFCIISNDCWGGEIYKILDRPFNTPFIGLMLMSPCYIKLLENPKAFLEKPLRFINKSKYPKVEQLRMVQSFPIAQLGETDIEISFLHYKSREIAAEKWYRRVSRIDWDNLYVKYDCGKDYADQLAVDKFIKFSFENKLIFGNNNYGRNEVILTTQYSDDALKQFKNCFINFNPVGWLRKRTFFTNHIDKFICSLTSKYL